MTMDRRSLLIGGASGVILTAAAIPTTARAGTVAGFGGSTEITQILNKFELILNAARSGATAAATATRVAQGTVQVAQQLQQLQTMIDNTVSLPDRLWADVQGSFNQLKTMYDQTVGLSWQRANVDDVIRNTFLGYEEYKTANLNTAQLSARFSTIADEVQETANQVIRASNMDMSELESDIANLTSIKGRSTSFANRNRLLQVGHEIAALQVENGYKLRRAINDQNVAVLGFQKAAKSIEEAERFERDRFFTEKSSAPTTP